MRFFVLYDRRSELRRGLTNMGNPVPLNRRKQARTFQPRVKAGETAPVHPKKAFVVKGQPLQDPAYRKPLPAHGQELVRKCG